MTYEGVATLLIRFGALAVITIAVLGMLSNLIALSGLAGGGHAFGIVFSGAAFYIVAGIVLYAASGAIAKLIIRGL